jgi:uncharacterized protein with PIN domain
MEKLMELLERFVKAVEVVAERQCKHENSKREWGTWGVYDRLDMRSVCYDCNTVLTRASADELEEEIAKGKEWMRKRDEPRGMDDAG